MSDRPDPSTLDVHELDRAEAELQRQYRVPSFHIARGEEPEHIPADVLAWWRSADVRWRSLILSQRGPLYVTDVEPMEPRKERLRKPGPPG